MLNMFEINYLNYIFYAICIWSIHLILFRLIKNLMIKICILESLYWSNIPLFESCYLIYQDTIAYHIGLYFFLANVIYFILLYFYHYLTKCSFLKLLGIYTLFLSLQILQLLCDFGFFLIVGIEYFNPIDVNWLVFSNGICWTYLKQIQLGLVFLAWSVIILVSEYFLNKKKRKDEKNA